MVEVPSNPGKAMLSHFPPLAIWKRATGFARFVIRRLIDDRCLQTAGSLTYTTLLAIVPLFTIALTLFSAFPMFGNYSGKFKAFILANLVPDASGRVIGVYMHQFSENAERLTAMGMVGLAATAWAAGMAGRPAFLGMRASICSSVSSLRVMVFVPLVLKCFWPLALVE